MAKIEEERVESLERVYSQIMDVQLQMEFLDNALNKLTKVLHSRGIIRKWIACGWCNHKEWEYNIQLSNPQFNLQCEICGKEGCDYCTDWFVRDGIKHYHHKFCASKERERKNNKERKEAEKLKKKEAQEKEDRIERKETYKQLKKEFEE